jgi:hypothetical protein
MSEDSHGIITTNLHVSDVGISNVDTAYVERPGLGPFSLTKTGCKVLSDAPVKYRTLLLLLPLQFLYILYIYIYIFSLFLSPYLQFDLSKFIISMAQIASATISCSGKPICPETRNNRGITVLRLAELLFNTRSAFPLPT